MLFSLGNLAGASAEERGATAISRKKKHTHTKDNDTRILSSERRKLLPVSKHNLQVAPGSAQIKRAQRSMARVRELVVPL